MEHEGFCEEGEEGLQWESTRGRLLLRKSKMTLFYGGFFLFYFLFQEGHFSNSKTQNDVVLGFPSIFTVSFNGGGHFIKG
jgi:hypothetical protein